MSCSATSISACTIKNTVTSEDPYIFTETTPTTPPILFNISQKSRNRVVVRQVNTASKVKVNKSQTTSKNLKLTKVKNHGAKTQTSSSITLKSAGLNTNAVLGVINTNNIKYGPQSPKIQIDSTNQTKFTLQQQQQHLILTQNENAAALSALVTADQATAACVINNSQRNIQQLQLQHQQKTQTQQKSQQHYQQQSQTPPPLLLSHTPSLWQTPLLLDTPKPAESTSLPTLTSTVVSTPTTSTTFFTPLNRKIKISFQSPTPQLAATTLMTPISHIPTLTTATISTTTNGITPIHLILPSAVPLPPSNFHSTTLAQHLQKVQCLKKSKKPNSPTVAANNNIISNDVGLTTTTSSLPELCPTTENINQHSTSDLNEIPVNVIFRSQTNTNNPSNGLSNCDESPNNRQLLPNELANIEKNNIVMKSPGTASNTPSQKPSSKFPQKRKNISPNSNVQPRSACQPSQAKQRKLQNKCELQKLKKFGKLSNISDQFSADLIVTNSQFSIDSSLCDVVKPQQKISTKQKSQGAGLQKTQKRNHKIRFASKLNMDVDQSDEFLTTGDFSMSTKAFAVVRMPYKQMEEDISLLAEESILPYCVQQHWFNVNDPTIRKSAVGREERIMENKNLLRRQAMQLLSTRSLQKLPFHIARKRLVCVDTLLRKYRDHNKTVFSATTKNQCEMLNCSNEVLKMASYCSQHIIKNTKQCIFVQCCGKNLKEHQKPCDIPVLNIRKPYSTPLCFLHANRYQSDCSNVNKEANSQLQLTKPVKSNQRIVIQKNPSNRKRKATSTTSDSTKTTAYLSNANIANINLLSSNVAYHMETPPPLLRVESSLQRKNSTTSLESITSNSHSSFASCMQAGMRIENSIPSDIYKQQQQQTSIENFNEHQTNMLSPPSLAPLSYNGCSIKNYINSTTNHFSSDYNIHTTHRENPIYGNNALDPRAAEQEINKLVAQFAMAAAATNNVNNINSGCNTNGNNINTTYNNNNNNKNSFNYMNTNSNSNLTSSGVGSSSSLPSTDELLTQDMLSICENSSPYASSSEDTGLGELSENEVIGMNGGQVGNIGNVGNGGVGCGSGFNDDDVSPDEIPLGDTRLLENDLVNVFGTLPVNLNELFTSVVRQDEREEIERALEIADKHLKTLQETIVSDTDFLADFLNVNADDILADTEDICSKMEIVSSVLSPPESLDAATMYLENTDSVLNASQHEEKNAAISSGNLVSSSGNANSSGIMDIRGLLQT